MAYTSAFRRLSYQLVFWFLLIALVPLELTRILEYRESEAGLRQLTMEGLSATAERQNDQISAFVNEHWRNISALSSSLLIEQSVEGYTAAFRSGTESAAYKAVDARFRPYLEELRTTLGFRDIYLISRSGDVVFSGERRADFGTNLNTGPYAKTAFGEVFDRANTLLLAEFSDYDRSEVLGQPAAFVAAPIARNAVMRGVVAILLDEGQILSIMSDYSGLGETGETQMAELRGQEVLQVVPLRHDPNAAFTRKVTVGSPNSPASQQAVRGYRGEGLMVDYRGKDTLAVWRYIPALSAGLVVKIDADEAFAPIAALRRRTVILGVLLAPLIIVAAVTVARSISAPIGVLREQTSLVAAGDLSRRVTVTARNEVGQLAEAFNTMTAQLSDSIVRLTETTRAKERIESELSLAHDIQVGILPKIFPPFPQRPEFDLHARLIPAREVGGDFYDFTLVNDRELFFVVGDVSGKGVPGALFMAVSRTLFKSAVAPGIAPSAILEKMNRDLCDENGPGLFVTIFCGRLDVQTGELAYANGGHCPPCLVRAAGHAEFFPLQGGLVLAVMADAEYRTDTLRLSPGDLLMLYTDGVTEAQNHEQALFGDQLLLDTLDRHRNETPAELNTTLAVAVKQFENGEPQADDITLLTLRYRG